MFASIDRQPREIAHAIAWLLTPRISPGQLLMQRAGDKQPWAGITQLSGW